MLLPVAVRGTRRPAGNNRRFRPSVDVLVGRPFAVPPGKGRAALTAATTEIRHRLTALVSELDATRCLGRPGAARVEGA
jgi:1-acyl-sn-glycerol-3-phosphate acyltransferase